MSELISRQAALDALKGFNVVDMISYEHGIIYVQAVINAIYNHLNNLPSAELKQKKGKWQRRKDEDCWECSECHAVLENSNIGNHNFYYCYHCGANMMDICGYMDLEKANYE